MDAIGLSRVIVCTPAKTSRAMLDRPTICALVVCSNRTRVKAGSKAVLEAVARLGALSAFCAASAGSSAEN